MLVRVPPTALDRLLTKQCGVVARSQLLALGEDDVVIERRLRRSWARVHEGVYVDHTGPRTWEQRAWAAVLVHAPAVLAGASALHAYGVSTQRRTDPIELAVDRSRRVDDPPGVTTCQVTGLDGMSRPDLSPPRVTLEHAVLTVASRQPTDDGAVAALAEPVRQGRTSVVRLREALDLRPRLPRRRLLRELLDDVAEGVHSALEHRYVRDVERAHGLPVGRRQVRAVDALDGVRIVYRDVEYEGQAVVVELDGRIGHEETEDRWADLDRDVGAVVEGKVTLRVRWGQVLDPCRLAAAVDLVLRGRGWSGAARPCGRPGCLVGRREAA